MNINEYHVIRRSAYSVSQSQHVWYYNSSHYDSDKIIACVIIISSLDNCYKWVVGDNSDYAIILLQLFLYRRTLHCKFSVFHN